MKNVKGWAVCFTFFNLFGTIFFGIRYFITKQIHYVFLSRILASYFVVCLLIIFIELYSSKLNRKDK